MADIKDYCGAEFLAYHAKDEVIKQLTYALDDVYMAQFEWDNDIDHDDKCGTLAEDEQRYWDRLHEFKREWLSGYNETNIASLLTRYIDRKIDCLRDELYEGVGVRKQERTPEPEYGERQTTDYEAALNDAIGLAKEKLTYNVPNDRFYRGYIHALADFIYGNYDTGEDDDADVMRKIEEGAEV